MLNKFLYTFSILLFAISAYADSESNAIGDLDVEMIADCQGVQPTIKGTIGNDVINGTDGDDVIHGYGGDDVINAKGGNDIVCGGSGNDTIYGGEGADTIEGGSNNDTIYGGCPPDNTFAIRVTCNPEEDGRDIITGGDGDDIISGNRGNDQLRGDADNDVINGNKGNDKIGCGAGNDTAHGGVGNEDEFFPPYSDCEMHTSVEKPQLRFSVESTPLYPGNGAGQGMYSRHSGRDFLISGKDPRPKTGFVQTRLATCRDFFVDGVVDMITISKSKGKTKRWEYFQFRCRELLPDGTKGQSTNVRLFDFTKTGKPATASIPNPNLMIGIMDVNSYFNPRGSLKQIKLLHLPTTTIFNDGVNGTTTSYRLTGAIPDTHEIDTTVYDQVKRCPPGMAITGFSVGHIPKNNKRTKPYFILSECREIEKRFDTY